MKITTVEQARDLEPTIGAQNAEAMTKLLSDGGEVWVFLTPEELKDDPDLSEQEKGECKKRFDETEGKFAGWFRPPKREKKPIPGFTAHPDYDAHGNARPRGSNGSSGNWSH